MDDKEEGFLLADKEEDFPVESGYSKSKGNPNEYSWSHAFH